MREFDEPVSGRCVHFSSTGMGNGPLGRLLWLNIVLPRRVRKLGADVLFSFANIAPLLGEVPTVVYCHQLNAIGATRITGHGPLTELRMRVLGRLMLGGAGRSKTIVVQTQSMAEALAAADNRLMGKIAVIPSGYRTLGTTGLIHPEVRSLVKGSSSPRIVYVSHPSEHKNHEVLLKAMPHIMQEIPSARLLLTLEAERPPNRRYAGFVTHLQSVAKNAGVADQITWLGILNSAEIHYLLTEADVMVFPSLAESFGLPLAEAMAAGCPIVVADLPYAHDVAGVAALYFQPADPVDLAERAIEVLRDESTRQKLIAAGAARRGRFCYADIAERLATVLSAASGADAQPCH